MHEPLLEYRFVIILIDIRTTIQHPLQDEIRAREVSTFLQTNSFRVRRVRNLPLCVFGSAPCESLLRLLSLFCVSVYSTLYRRVSINSFYFSKVNTLPCFPSEIVTERPVFWRKKVLRWGSGPQLINIVMGARFARYGDGKFLRALCTR